MGLAFDLKQFKQNEIEKGRVQQQQKVGNGQAIPSCCGYSQRGNADFHDRNWTSNEQNSTGVSIRSILFHAIMLTSPGVPLDQLPVIDYDDYGMCQWCF